MGGVSEICGESVRRSFSKNASFKSSKSLLPVFAILGRLPPL